MLKKLSIAFTFLSLTLLVCLYVVFVNVDAIGQKSVPVASPYVVHLKAGQSAQTVWRNLPIERTELEDVFFKIWLRMYPQNSQVKVGYYAFTSNQTVADIFERISSGTVTQFSIALVEGQTLQQWIAALKGNDTLLQDLPETSALYSMIVLPSSDQENSFCDNAQQSLEGCLLADTYFYAYQDSALSILRRAYQAMDSELDQIWDQRFQDIPLKTPYEALILASIIEKETAVPSERGTIAGVFSNRLELNMRLQTDPTVIYGIGPEFDGNITRAHLNQKTPYNTYRINGLPPTPIAMASRASLLAAVQPEITDYLYFVARGDGSHAFSTTLEEHNQAVVEFQLNK